MSSEIVVLESPGALCEYNGNMAERVGERLLNMGWESLGEGSNAVVYGKDGFDYVIKTVFEVEDTWVSFAHLCMTNEKARLNPFFPKIHRLFVSKDGSVVAIMERLAYTMSQLYNGGEIIGSRSKNEINNEYGNFSWAVDSKTIRGADLSPEAKEAVRILLDNYEDFDLHGENFMVRQDGQLVVIDPVYFTDGPAVKRFNRVSKKKKLFKMAA